MGKPEEKTNAMRLLDKAGVRYETFSYPADGALTGVQVAKIIGVDENTAFKTLVTQGKSGEYYVFDLPVNAELDLKKAAKAVGEKFVEMIKSKDLLSVTGYIHGGCSPVGMKKRFKTVFDQSANAYERICFSGGRLGVFLRLNAADAFKVVEPEFADITV